MIPQADIDRVDEAARARIVELVGEVVELKREGKLWIGCCPFHGEKKPSFKVNPEEGFVHCFGCGKSWTPISFWMESHGLTFPDAVKELGSRFGISVSPEETIQRKGLRGYVEERTAMRKRVVRKPVSVYARPGPKIKLNIPKFTPIIVGSTLPEIVKTFLRKRRITTELAERWGFGFILKYEMPILDIDDQPFLDKEGIPISQWFVNRLFLPDTMRGKIVYYQARTMDGNFRKYINPYGYSKTDHVYGAELASTKKAVVCGEGIFDAIAITEMASRKGLQLAGICTFGKKPTPVQMDFLAKAGVVQWITLLDPEVKPKEILEVSHDARRFFNSVKIGILRKNDPWDSTMDEIEEAVLSARSVDSYEIRKKLER